MFVCVGLHGQNKAKTSQNCKTSIRKILNSIIITNYNHLQVFACLAALQTLIFCSRDNAEKNYFFFHYSTELRTRLFICAEKVAVFVAKCLTGRENKHKVE